MKHIIKSRKGIEFNRKAPTSWNTLIVLVGFAFILVIYLYTCIKEQEYIEKAYAEEISQEEAQPKVILIETVQENNKRKEKEVFLDKLYMCESEGIATVWGDSGKSLGWYQWQKESLEDVMGQELTDEEYYAIATDFEQSRKWAKHAYFELGQWWRWVNCTNKIKAGKY